MDLKTKILVKFIMHLDLNTLYIAFNNIPDYTLSYIAKIVFEKYNLSYKDSIIDVNLQDDDILKFLLNLDILPYKENCVILYHDTNNNYVYHKVVDCQNFIMNTIFDIYNSLLENAYIDESTITNLPEFNNAYLDSFAYILPIKSIANKYKITLPESLENLIDNVYMYIVDNFDKLDDNIIQAILIPLSIYEFDLIVDSFIALNLDKLKSSIYTDFPSLFNTHINAYIKTHIDAKTGFIIDDEKKTDLTLLKLLYYACNTKLVDSKYSMEIINKLNIPLDVGRYSFYYDLKKIENDIQFFSQYLFTFNNVKLYNAKLTDINENDFFVNCINMLLDSVSDAEKYFLNTVTKQLYMQFQNNEITDAKPILEYLILYRIFCAINSYVCMLVDTYVKEYIEFLKNEIENKNEIVGNLEADTVTLEHLLLYLILNDDHFYKTFAKVILKLPTQTIEPYNKKLHDDYLDKYGNYYCENNMDNIEIKIAVNNKGPHYILYVRHKLSDFSVKMFDCYPWPCSDKQYLHEGSINLTRILGVYNIARYTHLESTYTYQINQWYSFPYSPCISCHCICKGWGDIDGCSGCIDMCNSTTEALKSYDLYWKVISTLPSQVRYFFAKMYFQFLKQSKKYFTKSYNKFKSIYQKYLPLEYFYMLRKMLIKEGFDLHYTTHLLADPNKDKTYYKFVLFHGKMEVYTKCPKYATPIIYCANLDCSIRYSNNPVPYRILHTIAVLKTFYKVFYSAFYEYIIENHSQYKDLLLKMIPQRNIEELLKRRPF